MIGWSTTTGSMQTNLFQSPAGRSGICAASARPGFQTIHSRAPIPPVAQLCTTFVGSTKTAISTLAALFHHHEEDHMSDHSTEALRRDVQTLIQDAKILFNDASALGSEEAEDLRRKGASLLHRALDGLVALERNAVRTGRQFVNGTNQYVHENPWMAVGVSAGVGVLIGMLISRR